jgi:hypothetical protein
MLADLGNPGQTRPTSASTTKRAVPAEEKLAEVRGRIAVG